MRKFQNFVKFGKEIGFLSQQRVADIWKDFAETMKFEGGIDSKDLRQFIDL